MRMLCWGLAASCLIASTSARADEEGPPRGAIAGVVTDSATHAPLSGATVIVTSDAGHAVVAGQTDSQGRYRVPNLPRGSYEVLFLVGVTQVLRSQVPVNPGVTTAVDGQLRVSLDETTIYEHPPTSLAKPIPSTVKKIPPYSDEAIDSNVWGVGWMLLDIDATGRVTSFRFLHRPSHKLDEVAEQEVWKLRFEPARDAGGQPVPTQLLWKMEWPAYWWNLNRPVGGFAGVYHASVRPMPIRASMGRRGVRPIGPVYNANAPFLVDSVDVKEMLPCAGDAPMNLDVAPIYRDCAKPDFSKLKTEPLIVRPPAAK